MSGKIISFEDHNNEKKISTRDARFYCLKKRQDEMQQTMEEMQDLLLAMLRNGCIQLDENSSERKINA